MNLDPPKDPKSYTMDDAVFEDAREWYAQKYLYPHTQLIYVLVAALILAYTVDNIFKILSYEYSTKKYPFPIYMDNQVEYFAKITPLATKHESINYSISRYLISEYVIAREEYQVSHVNKIDWLQNLKWLKASSSRKVFSSYLSYIDVNKNPSSPLLKYKLNTNRIIEIKSITFAPLLKGDDVPSSASVNFQATEINQYSTQVTSWIANLEFSFEDLNDATIESESIDIQKGRSVRFAVTQYNASLIDNTTQKK